MKRINKIYWHLFTMVILAMGIAGCPSSKTELHSELPNVVFIVTDDQGIDGLGCYGNDLIQTPHIDALAQKSTLFKNAFCTTSSCSPSRSVMLTGLHNHANGMYGLHHAPHNFNSHPHIQSLPYFLSANGYRTAVSGKYHLGPKRVYPFDQFIQNKGDLDLGRDPVNMAEACRSFINEKNGDPFFLFYNPKDPHRSLPSNTFPNPNNFGNKAPSEYQTEKVQVPTFLPDNEYTRSELAAYYQSISRVDDGVGKLTEILKESEQWDNTLIIYISDNGMAFPGAKTTLYESGIHLPCIVKTPGQSRGKISEALISWADLTPTILEVLGIQINGQFHGKSFKCVLEDDCEATKDTIFASHTFHAATHYYPMRAIRTKSHKLIWNLAHELEFPNSLSVSTTWKGMQEEKQQLGQRKIADFLNRPEIELYDLIEDPNEVNNLADDPAYEKLRNDLWQSIKHWQKDTGDPRMKEDEVLKLWKRYPWPHYKEE